MTQGLDISESREQAARIAARADIRDVRLFESSAKLLKTPVPDPRLSYKLDMDAQVEYDDGDDFFVVRTKYKLLIVERDDDRGDPFDDPDAAVAEIDFEQGGLFKLVMREQDAPPKTEELLAYAQSTGQFALYPFAREYIYDVTGRMELPPLTIGVMRIGLSRDDNLS